MKLGPLPKLEKRNTMTLKNFDNDVMLGNYDVIFNFEIYGRFGAIDAWFMTFSFPLITIFYLTKGENKTTKPLIQP